MVGRQTIGQILGDETNQISRPATGFDQICSLYLVFIAMANAPGEHFTNVAIPGAPPFSFKMSNVSTEDFLVLSPPTVTSSMLVCAILLAKNRTMNGAQTFHYDETSQECTLGYAPKDAQEVETGGVLVFNDAQGTKNSHYLLIYFRKFGAHS